MNRQSKSAIKSLVLTLRHKLEDDIAIQLKRYGFAGERWLPLDRLPHIEQDDQATIERYRLEAALEQHLRRIGADPEKGDPTPKQGAEAVDWFVREVAFTHLNRLVALKCLEVHGLVPEIITTRDAYGGRSRAHRDYRNAHSDEARRPDDALPAAIRHVCRIVFAEFKFLFDVGDPATGREPPANTILWPSTPVLKECIALINGLDEVAGLKAEGSRGYGVGSITQHATRSTGTKMGEDAPPDTLWAEDEIIGWIYQFYNAEEKEAIRGRGRPRRPAEVAVINQFFTPRWIIKFLVDNTLGRLWLEMHPESPRVREKCDYLVPEPLSVDQGKGDKETRGQGEFRLDPDSPINNPEAEPRRAPKPVIEIRLIDPACGTMHFGHYAFEVFQEMYLDSLERGWPISGSTIERISESATRRSSVPAYQCTDIPALILRHNLFGVDIDLRAVQLAGLSLFMKAKSADPDAHIAHLNLVVADAVLPEDGARKRFLDQYADDKVVQDAVRQVLKEMENVAEVGSLLRVEERLQDILGKAGHAAVQSWDADRQRELPGFKPQTRQLSLAEAQGAAPEEWGAHYTVARLMEDLRVFANRALQTHDLNAQLFAREAEKTVHLLDVFLNDYDVVVMNPPFGYPLANTTTLISRLYEDWCGNLLCAFYIRALSLLGKSGYIGMVSDKTFAVKKTYAPFRERYFLTPASLITFLDLGWDVLDDANVEVCSLVSSTDVSVSNPSFIDLQGFRQKRNAFEEVLISRGENLYLPQASDLQKFPFGAFGYRAPESILRAFGRLKKIDGNIAFCPSGGLDAPATEYYRYHWEVPRREIGTQSKYAPFWNGGAGFSPYYATFSNVLLWHGDGSVVTNDPRSNIRLWDYYFRPGVAWGKRGRFLNVCLLDKAVFSKEGQQIFPYDERHIWPLISFLNSEVARYSINLFCGQHKYGGYIGQLPFSEGLLNSSASLRGCAQSAHNIKASWDTGNEICTRFDTPWLVQISRKAGQRESEPASQRVSDKTSGIGKVLALLGDDAPEIALPERVTLEALLGAARAIERAADARLQHLQAQVDEAVYDMYEISEADRALIQRELGDRPPELVWPQMEGKSDREKRREHVRRLLSYFLLQTLKEKRDGILPLADGAGRTTALAEIRRRMEETFGEEAAFKMESEIKQVLGHDIADWLEGPFIKWHTKLYKRCPVIWQISSSDHHHTFNYFVYYHKMDADTLRKVQTLYLWPQRRAIESALETGRRDQREGVSGASSRVEGAEQDLEVLEAFEEQLLSVIEARVPYKPPEWAEGPFRGGIYDPVLDDGVKVNLMPLQEAGTLRYKRLV